MKNVSLFVLVVLALLVMLSFAGITMFAGIPYKSEVFKQGASTAGALFVVAVFLERALAVANSLMFGDDLPQANSNIILAANRTELDAELAQLRLVEERRQNMRLVLGFLFGVLVSAAGPRTLEALLDLSKVGESQKMFLYLVDVMLTAGLLAGGSNAIGKIAELLATYIKAARLRILLDVRAMVK